MRSVYPLVNAGTVGPGVGANALSFNVDFIVPNFAVGAIFFLNASAMSGTTPVMDLKFQRLDPISGVAKDVIGASIVQLVAAAAIVMTIDPRNVTVSNNVVIAQALSRNMRAVFTLDNTSGSSENYTFSLAAEFYS